MGRVSQATGSVAGSGFGAGRRRRVTLADPIGLGDESQYRLDGNKPNAVYRFIKRGDLTVTYVSRVQPITLQPVQN